MIFLQGILFGLAIAAPVGAMGLLCINKTLSHGKKEGLTVGFGIATGDFVYAIIAVFLYSFVSTVLNEYTIIFAYIGSSVLILLGLSFIFKKIDTTTNTRNSMVTFFRTFLLTLSNPATIVSFVAIAASLSTSNSWSLVFGIFVGSLLWWIILTNIVSLLRHKIGEKTIRIINIVSGITMIIFGLLNIWKVL